MNILDHFRPATKALVLIFMIIALRCSGQTPSGLTSNASQTDTEISVSTSTHADSNRTVASPVLGQKISLTLKDGTIKTGTLVRIDSEGVSMLTDDGGGTITFDSMSESDSARFGYARAGKVTAAQTETVTTTNASAVAVRKAIGQKVSLVLKDGTAKAGTVTGADPESISILTDDGGGKILFDSMSESDKAKFGFNQASEDSFRAQRGSQEAAYHAKKREERQQWEAKQAEEARESEFYKSQLILHVKVLQIVNDKDETGVLGYKTGVYATPTPDGEENLDSDLVFIKNCSLGGVHPDQERAFQVVQDGSYTYTTLLGGDQRTVPQFVVVPQEWCISNLVDPTEMKREAEAAIVPHRSVFPAPDTDGN